MRRRSRGLRWASHLVVLLWLGALLAWPAARQAPPSEPLARVQPVPQPPPAPEPPPAAEPAPPPASASAPEPPRPTRVSREELARGGQLLDGAGSFPVLSSSYEDFGSFADYAGAMLSLGARFAVVRNREIVGSIDPRSGVIGEAALDRAFSPRARDYAGEPGLNALARAARQRFGADAVVMMLVPRELDAGLFGGIASALAGRGESTARIREVRARYQRGAEGAVRLRVDSVVRDDGSLLAMDLLFDLTQIARSAAGEPA